MSRAKEVFLYAEEDAWRASPEYQAMQEERRREEAADAAEQARREQLWEQRYKTEWREWLKVRPLLAVIIDFGADKPFDFLEFLQEVGRCPSSDHVVARKDENMPFEPGNMEWVRPAVAPHPSPYLTLDEAAAYTRRRPKTLSNHICRGRLRAVPGTRPPLFLREDLDRWMNDPRKGRAR